MMFDLPIRIVLVLALVMWSPAWCCCAIAAASADADEIGGTMCQSRWSVANQAKLSSGPAELRPCCLGRVKTLSETSSEGATDENESENQSPCRCNDRPDELTRLDTAAKITLPQLERVAMPMVAVDASMNEPSGVGLLTHRLAARPHAPPRTLFDQHCLLLV
jgi:hypothetical protein